MKAEEIGNEELKIILVSILLVAGWLVIPLYLQTAHNFSAIKVSFGITVVYFVGFKLWKRFSRE